jgi:flagella basal body P-ring formation protein FlgA
MLWFEPLPYGRWALVAVIAVFALWVEFKPEATVDQPFATVEIAAGDTIDGSNTEMHRVPAGMLRGAGLGEVAVRSIAPGEPVLAGDVGDPAAAVPAGWWVVGVSLPQSAVVGDDVRLVMLDSGNEVSGVVAHPGSDDPFAAADGGVAVPSEKASDVALAAANGRLAVLIATG